jgi:hypothetical protein
LYCAIYVDGVIAGKHHIIAAVGADAQGSKHVLGLPPGSSENAKLVKDLLTGLINYKDAEMALRWTAAGFLEAGISFKKLRGHVDLKTLINGLCPATQQLRKAA